MSAAPLPNYEYEPVPESRKFPSWLIPPPAGFTAEDLDRIPGLPRHTELIDGSLVFVSPQTRFHRWMNSHLERRLEECVPPGLIVDREMTITIDQHNRPEPDVLVLRAESAIDDDQTTYRAEDVILAIEVVSPDSEHRDRKRKPALYAEAKIPHYWRVERVKGEGAVVYAYELDPTTEKYVPTGIHHGRVKVSAPFDIDIELVRR